MDAGVDHEPCSSGNLIRVQAHVIQRSAIKAEFVCQSLGVQRPALAETSIPEITGDRVNLVAELECNGTLQVMAWVGFMVQRGQLV